MVTIRRLYIFLICAISLHAFTWAVIALLQDLLVTKNQSPVTFLAFQIAVIVIGLPIFLVHWVWAQWLAGRESDERESALRRFYLYSTLAGFLSPFLANAFSLIEQVLQLSLGGSPRPSGFGFTEFSPTELILRAVVALVVLASLWFYHWRIVAADAKAAPETGNAATVRRLYVLGFSAVGGTLMLMAVTNVLRWVMFQFGDRAVISGAETSLADLTDDLAGLSVGVPLWLVFWHWAQGLFTGPSPEEHESTLRKLYLYLTIFIAVISAVTNAALILAGLFRYWLDLPAQGDIRIPLPIVISMTMLWAYHAYSLRTDAVLARETSRHDGIRRLYLYLVAAVGLAALLTGLSGDIRVLIHALAGVVFGNGLREQAAWFTAALIAGLPVWLLPWRQTQLAAVVPGSIGTGERRSVTRKIYLYLFLFAATLAVLFSLIYIAYRLLSLFLGARETGNLLVDLGQAIAFSLIAIGILVYHGTVLWGDGRLTQQAQAQRLANLRVAVVDGGEGFFGRAVLEGLRHELPAIMLDPIGLGPASATAMGMVIKPEASEAPNTNGQSASIIQHLIHAGLIIGPWNLYVTGAQHGEVTAEIAAAAIASPAHKLLVPVWGQGWEWVGVDHWSAEAIVQQVVRAVKQWAQGDDIKPVRPVGVGAIVGIILAVLLVLLLVMIILVYLYVTTRF